MSIFKSASGLNITTANPVLTAPVDFHTVLIGLTVSNVGAGLAKVSVTGPGGAHIVKDVEIPTGASLSALAGKIVLMPGEAVTVTSDVAVDCIVSYMESAA